MSTMEVTRLNPPLKWAGGKRWLVFRYFEHFPSEFSAYYEPFFGGGAVFFALTPSSAILSDTNPDLVTLYGAIKNDWSSVYEQLKAHASKHSTEYYYATRGEKPSNATDLAAWFLYMNRACYNGLYRVNLKGEFNVPKGTKDKILFDYDNFDKLSLALQKATIEHCDFEITIDRAQKNDFVYIDPPYTVRHNNNGFLKYNEDIFSWGDQERLASCVRRAAERGAQLLISNADHSSVRDLYSGLGNLIEVSRFSVIGGAPSYRSKTTEILVKIGY